MKEAAENKEAQCELLEPRIHEQAVLLLGSSQSHVADKSDVFERVLGFLLIIISQAPLFKTGCGGDDIF